MAALLILRATSDPSLVFGQSPEELDRCYRRRRWTALAAAPSTLIPRLARLFSGRSYPGRLAPGEHCAVRGIELEQVDPLVRHEVVHVGVLREHPVEQRQHAGVLEQHGLRAVAVREDIQGKRLGTALVIDAILTSAA